MSAGMLSTHALQSREVPASLLTATALPKDAVREISDNAVVKEVHGSSKEHLLLTHASDTLYLLAPQDSHT